MPLKFDFERRFSINMEGGGNGHAGSHFVRLFLWIKSEEFIICQNLPHADYGTKVKVRFLERQVFY